MEKRLAPRDAPIETCRRLLEARDFVRVRFIVEMNRLVRNNRSEFDQIQAICDVLIAAESRLPNGFMDYYSMLRVKRAEPVVLKDFKKLMKLLDGRENHFPCSQEAAQGALQAWSFLSKQDLKTKYDLALMLDEKKKKKKKTTRDCSKGRWEPSEDLKLRELVTDLGPRKWKCIAEKIHGRTASSCRLRWFNELNPMINKRAFSNEEDEKLLAAQREFGNKWSLIAKLFNGRTDNAVKHRCNALTRRLRKQSSQTGITLMETTRP